MLSNATDPTTTKGISGHPFFLKGGLKLGCVLRPPGLRSGFKANRGKVQGSNFQWPKVGKARPSIGSNGLWNLSLEHWILNLAPTGVIIGHLPRVTRRGHPEMREITRLFRCKAWC